MHIFRVIPETTAKRPEVKPRVQNVAVCNTTNVKRIPYVLYQWESIITNIFNTDSFMLTACACMWVQGKLHLMM